MNVYNYFAEQVLTAEKESGTIQMSIRKPSMPSGGDEESGRHAKVRAVGFVLKALLADIPGGVLGSENLYGSLVDIFYREFTETEFRGTKPYLSGISRPASARVYIITLAILAFANESQLELICAVFGFCAFLAGERERALEMWKTHHHSALEHIFSGQLSAEHLIRAFAPLLTDSEQKPHWRPLETDRDTEHHNVAKMLLENWLDITRMMRVFGSYGYPRLRVAIPRMTCGEHSGEEALPN